MTFDAIGRDLFPGERAAAKAFAARYASGTDSRGREQVRREQQRVIDEVRRAATPAQDVSAETAAGIPLLPLSAFQAAQLAARWIPPSPAAIVPLREGERFVVQFEDSSELSGHGPWRNDELANQGIDCSGEDARSFAQGLLNAINDRLSMYELEHIVAVFSTELARREAERQAVIGSPSTGACATPTQRR